MEDFVKFERIDKSYDGEVLVVKDLNVNIAEGEFLTLLGPSGSGKTTTLMMLAGFETPTNGEIFLKGTPISKIAPYERGIGMVFQKSHFVRNLSILDNLLLFLYLSNKLQDKQRAIYLLQEIGLSDKLNNMPDELSQGEQQRAAIATAIIKNPDLILADEPTSSLDDNNCQNIITLLKEQAALTNTKLIIITHDQRLKDQFNKSILL